MIQSVPRVNLMTARRRLAKTTIVAPQFDRQVIDAVHQPSHAGEARRRTSATTESSRADVRVFSTSVAIFTNSMVDAHRRDRPPARVTHPSGTLWLPTANPKRGSSQPHPVSTKLLAPNGLLSPFQKSVRQRWWQAHDPNVDLANTSPRHIDCKRASNPGEIAAESVASLHVSRGFQGDKAIVAASGCPSGRTSNHGYGDKERHDAESLQRAPNIAPPREPKVMRMHITVWFGYDVGSESIGIGFDAIPTHPMPRPDTIPGDRDIALVRSAPDIIQRYLGAHRAIYFIGVPGRTRTPGHLVRSHTVSAEIGMFPGTFGSLTGACSRERRCREKHSPRLSQRHGAIATFATPSR